MKKFITFCLFLLSLNALATSGHIYKTYYTLVHFDAYYFSQEVVNITAVGAIKMEKNNNYWKPHNKKGSEFYWADSQDIQLERKGDHFFGKMILNSEFHTHYGDIPLGPFISYRLELANGSSVKIGPFQVKATERFEDKGDLFHEFEDKQDAYHTHAFFYTFQYASK